MKKELILNTDFENYILSCIEDKEIPFTSDEDKLKYLLLMYKSDYNINYLSKHHLKEYLTCLPECFNIHIYPNEILNMGYLFNMLPANCSEDRENEFIENWYILAAQTLINLCKNFNVI